MCKRVDLRGRACQTLSEHPSGVLVVVGREEASAQHQGKKFRESFLTRAGQSCAMMDSLSAPEQMNR